MRFFVIFSAFCSIFMTACRADNFVPPTEDPFYTPPEGYENEPDGTILRWRTTPHPISPQIYAHVQNSYHLLYKSTDDLGRAFATVTTVVIPYKTDYKKVVSYHIAEDSAYLNCAPSYSLQLGSNIGLISSVEFVLVQSLLNLGYILVFPDYEGPRSAFTVGRVAGVAVLDSVRAVLASQNHTGVDPEATVALWGYSGGSIASGWAAQLQPDHAPELKLAGAVFGGVVPNISSVAFKTSGGPFAGLIPSGINGFAAHYDDVQQVVNENIISTALDAWNKSKSQCLAADILQYTFQDIWKQYSKIGDAFLDLPVIKARVEENTLGFNISSVPEIPIFMYHAVNDEIAPVADVDNLYQEWCEAGIDSLYYEKDFFDEHVSEEALGVGNALLWLHDLFEGTLKPVSGCKKVEIFSQLFPVRLSEVIGPAAVAKLLQIGLQPESIDSIVR